MKEILLVPKMEYEHKLEVDVMDFVDDAGAKARKRCGITLDYGWRDIEKLDEAGMDMEARLEFYEKKIYELVKLNIAQDWVCAGGMDEVREILKGHVAGGMKL